MSKTYEEAQKKKIDTALAMDEEFHDWEASFEPNEALAFVTQCEIYNRMTRKGMVGLVKHITKKAPKREYGEGNPNNSHPCVTFRIGNQGSRVLYAIFPRYALPPGTNLEKLLKDIEKYAKNKAHCDEFQVSEDDLRGLTVRTWWD